VPRVEDTKLASRLAELQAMGVGLKELTIKKDAATNPPFRPRKTFGELTPEERAKPMSFHGRAKKAGQ
jgi:hypothetical protein